MHLISILKSACPRPIAGARIIPCTRRARSLSSTRGGPRWRAVKAARSVRSTQVRAVRPGLSDQRARAPPRRQGAQVLALEFYKFKISYIVYYRYLKILFRICMSYIRDFIVYYRIPILNRICSVYIVYFNTITI